MVSNKWFQIKVKGNDVQGQVITFILLGGAQPVIPPNLYLFMNIIAWGLQVTSIICSTAILVFSHEIWFTTILVKIV